MCRSGSGGTCRRPTDGGFGCAAHEAAELPGPAPAGGPISCTDKKWGKEAAGGRAPLTPVPPPVGLRPKSAAPCHGSMGGCTASRQPPRRGRNASAGESPEPYRECAWGRHGRFCVARSAHGEAENCAATPRTRAERANARNGRCFPPCIPGESSDSRIVGCSGTSLLPAAEWT